MKPAFTVVLGRHFFSLLVEFGVVISRESNVGDTTLIPVLLCFVVVAQDHEALRDPLIGTSQAIRTQSRAVSLLWSEWSG